MKLALFCAILFAGVIPSPAPAAGADEDATISSSVEPMFVDGALAGCSVVFNVVHSDSRNFHGEPVDVSGSLNYLVRPSLGVSLKLGVWRVGAQGREAPAEAYLLNGYNTNKADEAESGASDTKGYMMFVFLPGGETAKALAGVGTGHLAFGYAMAPGNLLSTVQVDIRNKNIDFDHPEQSTFDDAAPREWMDCLKKVDELELKRLKSNS